MPEPNKYSILIVDDEPDILQSLHGLLRMEYRVHVVRNGVEALELIRRQAMQVVMSDQRMPDMTGVQPLSQVEAESPETMRILFTGYADIDAVIDSVNHGHIFRYIAKPWEPEEMQTLIRLACAVYRQCTQRQRLLLNLRSHVLEGHTLMRNLREGAHGQLNVAGEAVIDTYTEKGLTFLGRVSSVLTSRQIKWTEGEQKE